MFPFPLIEAADNGRTVLRDQMLDDMVLDSRLSGKRPAIPIRCALMRPLYEWQARVIDKKPAIKLLIARCYLSTGNDLHKVVTLCNSIFSFIQKREA